MLLKLLKKPHVLFWAIVPFLLFLSWYRADQTLDINVHDTYFVISQQYIYILLSLFFGLTGCIYWILKYFSFQPLIVLSILHLIFTVGFVLINGISGVIVAPFLDERYYTNSHIPGSSLVISIFSIIAGQLIFIINVILSLCNGRKKEV